MKDYKYQGMQYDYDVAKGKFSNMMCAVAVLSVLGVMAWLLYTLASNPLMVIGGKLV